MDSNTHSTSLLSCTPEIEVYNRCQSQSQGNWYPQLTFQGVTSQMNSKMIGYIVLIVIGAVGALLSGWVFLLNGELRFLGFALVGVLAMIAGIVRMRRERQGA